MILKKINFKDVVLGEEGLLKGPFGSDLKKSIYVPRSKDTYKVYLQENILKRDITKGKHYITKDYFNKSMSRYEVKEGDFIVTCDGTLGEIFQLKGLKEKGIISSSLLRITLNTEILDEVYFPYLWEQRIKYPLIRSHENSVLKHLPGLKAIRNFQLEIPDLQVQKKIAKVLSLLDSKIDLNRQINAKLEEMAKALFDYWFIQFDFPDKDGKPYKTSDGKMVWNEKLKREIPEGWDVTKVENILTKGDTQLKIASTEYLSSGRIPVIDQSIDFIAGYTNNLNASINGNKIPRIVFGDHTRILKLINFDFARGADGTQVIVSNNNRIPQHLLYHSLLKIDLSNFGYARHFKFLKDSLVILPDINVSNAFEEISTSFYVSIRENIIQNIKLTQLRDWLLPMLMNGQVKVK